MHKHRFNVFGRIYRIERQGSEWRAFSEGADGKSSPAHLVIPDFIGQEELEQFLADLFHESATPTNGDVRRID